MLGDFSRLPHDPRKQYSRVWMQQGRVQLDADWNTSIAITSDQIKHLMETLIGFAGAPRLTAGFRLGALYGYRFDNATSLSIPSGIPLPFGNRTPFTLNIALFVTVQNKTVRVIIGDALANDDNILNSSGSFLLYLDKDDTLVFSRFEIDIKKSPVVTSVRSKRKIPLNKRVMATITYDGKNLSLYLDRVLHVSQTTSNAAQTSSQPITMGAQGQQSGSLIHFFSGYINELRIWGTAFDAAKIAAEIPLYGEVLQDTLLLNWDFGAPFDNGNLELTPNTKAVLTSPAANIQVVSGMWITPGDYVINGLGVKNPYLVSFALQPYVPRVQIADVTIEALQSTSYLFYLDVWERFVASQFDPELKEVALGGLDTTARNQTIWQVWALPLSSTPITNQGSALELALEKVIAQNFNQDSQALAQTAAYLNQRGNTLMRGTLSARYNSTVQPLQDNHLYRVEIHHPGEVYVSGATRDNLLLPNLNPRLRIASDMLQDAAPALPVMEWSGLPGDWQLGQPVVIYTNDEQDVVSKYDIITGLDYSNKRLSVSNGLDASWLDREVEIRRLASMKWSKQNGITLLEVLDSALSSGNLTITVASQDYNILVSKSGPWVELVSDTYQLSQIPGPLYQILSAIPLPDGIRLTVNSLQPLPRLPHLYLRLWDGVNGLGPDKAHFLSRDSIPLEANISVNFDTGLLYNTGDYWTIPARATTNAIGWQNNTPHYAQGIEHRYTPISQTDVSQGSPKIHDLRFLFDFVGPASAFVIPDAVEPLVTGLDRQGPVMMAQADEQHRDLAARLNRLLAFQEHLISHLAVRTAPLLAPAFEVVSEAEDVDETVGTWRPIAKNTSGPKSALQSIVFPKVVDGQVTTESVIYCYWTQTEPTYASIYDPGSNQWQEISVPEQIQRLNFSVVTDGKKIYLVGGEDDSKKKYGQVDVFNPVTNQWEQSLPRLNNPRSFVTAVMRGSTLYVIGGIEGDTTPFVSTAVEMFNLGPGNSTGWQALPKGLQTPRAVCGAVEVDGNIYVVGGTSTLQGSNPKNEPLASLEVLDKDNTWLTQAPPALPQGVMAMGLIGDDLHKQLYVIGGRGPNGSVGATQIYSTVPKLWQQDPDMNEPRAYCGTVQVGQNIVVIGGQNKNTLETRVVRQQSQD